MPVHLMPMPKTPVHEYRHPVLPVAVTPAPEVAAHDEFRLRVLAADFRHDGGSFLFVPDVHD